MAAINGIMPEYEYSAKQALEVVLESLHGRFPDVERRIREVIDSGKIVFEEEFVGKKKRRHKFPVRVPLSDEQALLPTGAEYRRESLRSLRVLFVSSCRQGNERGG